MTFKRLLTSNDRAVSPVIGVVLMVALTVILAAVIGTFVLGARRIDDTTIDANGGEVRLVRESEEGTSSTVLRVCDVPDSN